MRIWARAHLVAAVVVGVAVVSHGCGTPAAKQGASDDAQKGKTADAPKAVSVNRERTEQLKALGYFDRIETAHPDKRSVTRQAERTFDGYNLYNSRHRAEAKLIDMSGEVVHTWRAPEERPPWMYTVLLPNGDLLALAKSNYLARLSFDSKVIWRRVLGAHHDITLDGAGRIYVLSHRIRTYTYDGAEIPIMDDAVVVLTPEGQITKKRRLFPLLRDLVPRSRLARIKRQVEKGVSAKQLVREGAAADTTHVNSIQVISKPIEGIAPAGAVLLSVREIDRIVILSPQMDRRLWTFGKAELQGQHHAVQIGNGHITIFDNGTERKQSRVVEIAPTTGEIVWSYTHPEFFSRLRGSAQTLPNGNVLITQSDKGYVFEVTRRGKKVWEYWNPDVIGTDPPTRAVIYRMMRYPLDYLSAEVPLQGS